MSPEIQALLAGAIISLASTLITKFVDSKAENRKWEREQKNRIEDSFKTQLGLTGKKLLQIQQAVNWMCWAIHKTPKKVSLEQIGKYDQQVSQIFPEVLAELVEISIISPESYEQLNAEFDKIIKIDGALAKLLDDFSDGDKLDLQPSKETADLLERIIALRSSLLEAIKACVNHFHANAG